MEAVGVLRSLLVELNQLNLNLHVFLGRGSEVLETGASSFVLIT